MRKIIYSLSEFFSFEISEIFNSEGECGSDESFEMTIFIRKWFRKPTNESYVESEIRVKADWSDK